MTSRYYGVPLLVLEHNVRRVLLIPDVSANENPSTGGRSSKGGLHWRRSVYSKQTPLGSLVNWFDFIFMSFAVRT